VHAHVAHSPGGACLDVGERGSCFISLSSTKLAEIRGDGERRIITLPDE
jgi:hypothetical protein